MAATYEYRADRYDYGPATAIHPVYAVLLAATVPLFLGGLLADIAYSMTYEMQWSNFAAWLIMGGMVFTGFALIWAFIDLFRAGRRRARAATGAATSWSKASPGVERPSSSTCPPPRPADRA